MAANFKVKNRQDFEWIAQVFKPSNQLTDLGTEIRKAKSLSGIRHSLQIGYVETPNLDTYSFLNAIYSVEKMIIF